MFHGKLFHWRERDLLSSAPGLVGSCNNCGNRIIIFQENLKTRNSKVRSPHENNVHFFVLGFSSFGSTTSYFCSKSPLEIFFNLLLSNARLAELKWSVMRMPFKWSISCCNTRPSIPEASILCSRKLASWNFTVTF